MLTSINYNRFIAYLCLLAIVAVLFIVMAAPKYLRSEEALKLTERVISAQRLKMRRQHLGEKCLELDLYYPDKASNYTITRDHYLVNPDKQLIWCPVYKAASTSWLYNFNILAGFSKDFLKNYHKNPKGLQRQRYPVVSLKELRAAQNASITFLIVRHPFERLVSGYRDKLGSPNVYYYNRFGKTIIQNYRKKGERPPEPQFPTFPEFVRWLNDLIVAGAHINEHFEAVTTFCTPCLIEIDLVLKFETLIEDQNYLLDLAGVSHLIKSEWLNKGPSCANATSYFAQLTPAEINTLHEYYRYDFELFGYSAKPYIDAVVSFGTHSHLQLVRNIGSVHISIGLK